MLLEYNDDSDQTPRLRRLICLRQAHISEGTVSHVTASILIRKVLVGKLKVSSDSSCLNYHLHPGACIVKQCLHLGIAILLSLKELRKDCISIISSFNRIFVASY